MSKIQDLKILVMDDFDAGRAIVIKILKEIGVTKIHEAEDGLIALKKIYESVGSGHVYDYIIADCNMPTMGGLDVLKSVKQNENLKKIKFIMVTSMSESDTVLEATKWGLAGYIIKPVTAQLLRTKIEKTLENN